MAHEKKNKALQTDHQYHFYRYALSGCKRKINYISGQCGQKGLNLKSIQIFSPYWFHQTKEHRVF